MKGTDMKYLLIIILLMAILSSAGCVIQNNNPPVTPTHQIVYVTVLETTQTPHVYYSRPPEETMNGGVEQSTSNVQMIGNVYGLSTNNAGITEIRFTIGLAPFASPIDLTKMKIVFFTPSTTPITLTQGTTATTSKFTTKLNGVSNVNLMNANEQIEIAFKVSPVSANSKMTIELKPEIGTALPFSKTAPTTIAATNVLY